MKYKVTNIVTGTSKTIEAKNSTSAKQKAVKNVKFAGYSKKSLMTHLTARRIKR